MAASPTTTTTPGRFFAYVSNSAYSLCNANRILGHQCMIDIPLLMTENDSPVFYSYISILGVGGCVQSCHQVDHTTNLAGVLFVCRDGDIYGYG